MGHRQNYTGVYGTTYTDWAKQVLVRFSTKVKFHKNEEAIEVFLGDRKVAEFDFATATGYIEASEENHTLDDLNTAEMFAELKLSDVTIDK